MDSVLQSAYVKNIKQVNLVFIPKIQEKHLYCVCFSLKDYKIEVLDNSATVGSFEGKYKKLPEKLVCGFHNPPNTSHKPKTLDFIIKHNV
ncbi:hypothetical protein Hanom_Chr10g00902341 [Helianthus anomalus]